MRRHTVPTVAPALSWRVVARLRGMLDGPPLLPAYDPKLQPLGGVWWPRPRVKVAAPAGDVAMFEVEDPGELQEWGARGVAPPRDQRSTGAGHRSAIGQDAGSGIARTEGIMQ